MLVAGAKLDSLRSPRLARVVITRLEIHVLEDVVGDGAELHEATLAYMARRYDSRIQTIEAGGRGPVRSAPSAGTEATSRFMRA